MNGAAFLFLVLVGAGLDRLWLHRDVVAAWLVDAVDWLTVDPPASRPVTPPRSHVSTFRSGDDDLGAA